MLSPTMDRATNNRPHSRVRWAILVALICLSAAIGSTNPATAQEQSPSESTSGQPTIATIAQLVQTGDLATATKQVTELDDDVIGQPSSNVDTTLLLTQVARAWENKGDDSAAAELYLRANAASKRVSSQLNASQIAMIQLAAGSSLVRAHQPKQAVDILAEALQTAPTPSSSSEITLNVPASLGSPQQEVQHLLSPRQRASAGQLLMLLGSEALTESQSELAEKAYDTALPHVAKSSKATVMLGKSWAISMQKGREQDAADALASFVQQYPTHSDVASAAGLCIAKRQACGDSKGVETMTARLLTRWSESKAASDLIRQFAASPITEIPQAAKTWLLSRAEAKRISGLDPATTATALLIAIDEQQPDLSDALIAHLAATDQSGQAVSDTLHRLASNRRAADAEQFASRLVSPATKTDGETVASKTITPAAREAACRWAGRRQLWSMLAMASELSDPGQEEPSRTVTVERLYAEALTQTGRGDEALVWWNHLVDSRQVDDFATLLRCAETATSHAEIPVATNRISDARAAAGGAPNKTSLVDMLAAELSVRELRFDQARSILEQIVRSDGAVQSVRGRAQWTIGETYYLQEKFADAIEAYRKVEGIDAEGQWIAVSLVQAGKSFEQLGRTREAAVCYSTLVSRFAESPHSVSARRRLAAIDPQSNHSQPNSSPSTDTFRR
ncbi:tetratricopeptide repeat protein [Planctomycetes bacterium K23_9]|uniref:Tetratricopeptide repeat protein n=1 Tax=Stieleria marina TaxID=1930275 RepID=A0A517NV96_9BACT|nr:Tetratricopeptide repeat protein [Planctomycetes bacterium K23_9]